VRERKKEKKERKKKKKERSEGNESLLSLLTYASRSSVGAGRQESEKGGGAGHRPSSRVGPHPRQPEEPAPWCKRWAVRKAHRLAM
jgi:hypothetical protein